MRPNNGASKPSMKVWMFDWWSWAAPEAHLSFQVASSFACVLQRRQDCESSTKSAGRNQQVAAQNTRDLPKHESRCVRLDTSTSSRSTNQGGLLMCAFYMAPTRAGCRSLSSNAPPALHISPNTFTKRRHHAVQNFLFSPL
jgi:hypothetical protein